MIVLKTSRELSLMRKAGKISQKALRLAGEAVEPGVSTWEIDKIVRQYIESQGATPSFLGYGGFPASACISVNNVVIHGIPSKSTLLKKGDIVGIDIGACYEGYHCLLYTSRQGDARYAMKREVAAHRGRFFRGVCPI